MTSKQGFEWELVDVQEFPLDIAEFCDLVANPSAQGYLECEIWLNYGGIVGVSGRLGISLDIAEFLVDIRVFRLLVGLT